MAAAHDAKKTTPLASGLRIPLFQKRGRPSPFSQRDINLVVRALNALLGLRVVRGDRDGFFIGENGSVLQLSNARGSGSAGGELKAMLLVSHSEKHLVCTDTDGNTVNVAKPELLRWPDSGTTGTRTVDSIVFSTTYASHSTTDQTRTVTWTEAGTARSETQVIVPRYVVGDIVWAESVLSTDVTVGGTAVTYQDVNVAGRAWARINGEVRGTHALVNGATSGSVAGLGLAATPAHVFIQVHRLLAICTTTAAPTTDGFDYALSGPPSDDNAYIDYVIYF